MAQNTLNFTINLGGTAYTGIAQIDKALNNVNVNASKTEKLMDRINNASFKFNNILQTCQVFASKVSGAIGKIIDVGGENELQKINMVTLFRGNALAAEDMYKKIKQYGKDTVYENKGLIEGINTMMQYQISGEKAFKTLKQIGDIAMGDATKMQSLTLAFSQATAAGKLQGNDYKQMIGAGFNPLLVISEKTGESIASLEAKMSKGAISAKMLSQAFTWATEEGGLFYQGAEKAGDSTMGKINQLKDTFDEFLIGVFNKLKPVIDTCLSFAAGFLETLPALFDGIANGVSNAIGFFSEFAPIIIGVASAIGVLTVAMKAQDIILGILVVKEKLLSFWTKICAGAQAILNAVMALNPITLIIAGIVALVGAIVWVCSKITGWGTVWKTFSNGFLNAIDKMRLAWFKFKSTLGLGDESENEKMIKTLTQTIENRKKEMGIKLGWKKTEEVSKASEKVVDDVGTNEQLQSLVKVATDKENGSGNGNSSLAKSNEAIATGGTRNTSITINLGEMIGSVTFNGSLKETREDFERTLAESMFRVLAIAQSSVG